VFHDGDAKRLIPWKREKAFSVSMRSDVLAAKIAPPIRELLDGILETNAETVFQRDA
jgi:hypothetical protein